MKASKRKFNQGGFYENKTDFVLRPTDFAALGANYDQLTLKYLDAQKKAKQEQEKRAQEGIKGFESRTKVMDRHNGVLQASYDIWENARVTAISNPSAANKQAADEAFSQYSVIKENAVAITADYQREVNDLNKGSLDADLLGTRAQAINEAKEFNREIPFRVVGGRVLVPGADGEPVEYLQSTYVNEGVFGQNGRNFIASRRAPGTDFMFAPLSDSYAKQLQGDADIFNVVSGRKQGLNEAAVGSRVAQRLQTDFRANPAAFVDAVSTQYGAFSYGVENLNVDNMNKAQADYGGIDIYSDNFLTNWSLTYNPKTEENPEGNYTLSFVNSLDDAVSSGKLNPLDAAAIKNRREALKYHIENTADQTLFKLKNQFQPSPQGGGLSFGGGFKSQNIPSFRDIDLYTTVGDKQQRTGQKGSILDFRSPPLNFRYKDTNSKITNIQFDENKNIVAFDIESKPMRDALVQAYGDEIESLDRQLDRIAQRLLEPGMLSDDKDTLKQQQSELDKERETLENARKSMRRKDSKLVIPRRGLGGQEGSNLYMASNVADIPTFDEILNSLLAGESQLMTLIQRETGVDPRVFNDEYFEQAPGAGGVDASQY
tara:strand:+ start:1638 stop:3440 length:1803 start_codon:yes stop_codon:yes gene_type:complete